MKLTICFMVSLEQYPRVKFSSLEDYYYEDSFIYTIALFKLKKTLCVYEIIVEIYPFSFYIIQVKQ